MKKNLGSLERVLRFVIAAAVAALYLTNQISGLTAIILGIVATAFIVTSMVGFCPIYASCKFLLRKADTK